jgi:hypothetical protein
MAANRLVILAVCALATSCAQPAKPLDPRSCRGVPASDPVTTAVLCAEEFVRRNGYTGVPAGDSADIAMETIEFYPNWKALLAARANSIEPSPAIVCNRRFLRLVEPGYTVMFRYRKQMTAPELSAYSFGRAVSMTADFRELRMEHQSIVLTDTIAGCRPV